MARSTMLIAGASGLVGQAAFRQFAAMPDWDVIGLARRVPAGLEGGRLFSIDLCDKAACEELMARIGPEVTHLVFTAQYETPGLADGWVDLDAIDRNRIMLENLFEPLRRHATGLRHVSLMQGSKAYGMHREELFDQIRTPLKERNPRLDHPNFYFVQQDYLAACREKADWGFTVFRPTVIYGDAAGVNMNVIRPIAVYAALEREKGHILHYPGENFDQPFREGADSDLIARALAWAAESPAADRQVFNLANGDTFTWRFVWDAVAESFGMVAGEQRPMSFANDLPRRDAEWAALVDRYGLDAPRSIEAHVGANSLVYADWMLGGTHGMVAPMNSTIAIRQAGFADCIDTEDMFRKWFRVVQERGVVPDRVAVNA